MNYEDLKNLAEGKEVISEVSKDPRMIVDLARNVKTLAKDMKGSLTSMKSKHASMTTKRAGNSMLKKVAEIQAEVDDLLKKIG